MDKLAQEDHSYHVSREEYLRFQKHWYLTLNKSGTNAPMRLRSDFRAAVTKMKSVVVCRSSYRTVRLVEEFGSLSSSVRKIHVGSQKMSKSGFFGNDKKKQILADCRAEIQNTSSKPMMTEVSWN